MIKSRLAGYAILLIYPALLFGGWGYEAWSCGWNRGLWQDVVCKSPDKPRGHNNLGRAYHLRGQRELAVIHYQEAARLASIRLNRDHSDFLSRDELAAAQSNLGFLLLQEKDFENAETAFRGVLSVMPFFGPATVHMSQLLILTERYAEAITVIDEALIAKRFGGGFDEIAGVSRLYQNKGIAMAHLGDCKNANLNFQKAAKMDPDIPPLECN